VIYGDEGIGYQGKNTMGLKEGANRSAIKFPVGGANRSDSHSRGEERGGNEGRSGLLLLPIDVLIVFRGRSRF